MKRRKLYEYIRRIAKLYGATVKFKKFSGGFANHNGTLTVGTDVAKKEVVSTFCHELAHHMNLIDGKYKDYHDGSYAWMDRKDVEKSVKYAYKAEVYTDKRGKKLCKQWFPGVKYRVGYDGSQYSKGFLFGYYYRS